MAKRQEVNPLEVELESLSNEVKNKALMMARQNAQVYQLAQENDKLKKKVKSLKSKSKESTKK